MEEIINFEKFVDEKLIALEEETTAWRRIKIALNEKAIKKAEWSPNVTRIKGNSIILNEDLKGYPLRKKPCDKVIYFINREKRALRFPEIIDYITEIEGEKGAKKTSKSLSGLLIGLVKRGTLLLIQYSKQKKLSFYIKPEWLSEDQRDIIPDFKPSPEATAGFSEDQISPNNLKIKGIVNGIFINQIIE